MRGRISLEHIAILGLRAIFTKFKNYVSVQIITPQAIIFISISTSSLIIIVLQVYLPRRLYELLALLRIFSLLSILVVVLCHVGFLLASSCRIIVVIVKSLHNSAPSENHVRLFSMPLSPNALDSFSALLLEPIINHPNLSLASLQFYALLPELFLQDTELTISHTPCPPPHRLSFFYA